MQVKGKEKYTVKVEKFCNLTRTFDFLAFFEKEKIKILSLWMFWRKTKKVQMKNEQKLFK